MVEMINKVAEKLDNLMELPVMHGCCLTSVYGLADKDPKRVLSCIRALMYLMNDMEKAICAMLVSSFGFGNGNIKYTYWESILGADAAIEALAALNPRIIPVEFYFTDYDGEVYINTSLNLMED